MKTLLKKTPILHIASAVEGGSHQVIARIPLDSLTGTIRELSHWKRFNRAQGNDWVDVSVFGVAVMTLEYAEMAEKGLFGEHDHLTDMHFNCLVWLLHRLGKLREAERRAKVEMAILRITPGLGLKGVKVSFAPLPAALWAANDNVASPVASSQLH